MKSLKKTPLTEVLILCLPHCTHWFLLLINTLSYGDITWDESLSAVSSFFSWRLQLGALCTWVPRFACVFQPLKGGLMILVRFLIDLNKRRGGITQKSKVGKNCYELGYGSFSICVCACARRACGCVCVSVWQWHQKTVVQFYKNKVKLFP